MMKDEKNKVFANNLSRILNETGKRQIDISRDLNIPKTTVNSWIKGRSVPLFNTCVKLADYLNVSVDEFAIIRDKNTRSKQ